MAAMSQNRLAFFTGILVAQQYADSLLEDQQVWETPQKLLVQVKTKEGSQQEANMTRTTLQI